MRLGETRRGAARRGAARRGGAVRCGAARDTGLRLSYSYDLARIGSTFTVLVHLLFVLRCRSIEIRSPIENFDHV